jgi:hypothetical protein
MTRHNSVVLGALALVLLVALNTVFAVNDPGHDSLYVLKLGDSNVSGSINLTGNLTATLVQATSRFFGPNIDIRGDGTSSTAPTRIIGGNTNLELSTASGGILLANNGGYVQVGTMSTPANLLVNGSLLVFSVPVCLANGTNCLTGNNTGNITTITNGNGITVTNANGPITTIALNYGSGLTIAASQLVIDNATVCRSDGKGCPPSALGDGWTNTSTVVSIVTLSNNLSANTLFVDNTDGRVGIGTTAPMQKLDVNGSINVSGAGASIYVGSRQVCLSDGTNCVSGSGGGSGWTNTSTATTTMLNVGIGTPSPNTALEINATGHMPSVNPDLSSQLLVGGFNATNSNMTSRILLGTDQVTSRGFIQVETQIVLGTSPFNGVNDIVVAPIGGSMYLPNSQSALGVGTRTSPTASLQVNSSNILGSLLVQNTTGSTHLFVNGSSGFVGIGNATPAYRLTVQWLPNDTSATAFFGSNDPNNNQNAVYAKSYSSYGIRATSNTGTAVYGQSSQSYGVLGQSGTGGTSGLFATFVSGNTAPTLVTQAGSSQTGDLFQAQNASGNPLVVIGVNGNVGIGTTNPSEKLAVSGNLSSTGGAYLATSSGNVGIGTAAPTTRLSLGSASANAASSKIAVYDDGTGNNVYGIGLVNNGATYGVSIFSSTTTTGNPQMVVLTSGNVGIGTTSPGTKLEVNGEISSSGSTQIISAGVNGNNNGAAFRLRGATSVNNNWQLANDWNGGYFEITPSTAAGGNTYTTPALAILNSGNVGIGTTGPAAALEVNGTSLFDTNTTYTAPASASLTCFERVIGSGWNYSRCINSTGSVIERSGNIVI